MSVVERATATDNGNESDDSTENAKLLGQLDACVQLMQRGSLLLVFHTQGVRMAFFNVSADGNALHWDYVEENSDGDVVPVDATRTHVLPLRTVVDVSPNNSLAALSSNDVFALRITVQDGGELNIIAPSKTDFAVWFYGLAFLQRLMSSEEADDGEAQEGGEDDTQSSNEPSSVASSEDVRRLISQVRNQNLAQEEDSDGYLEGNDGAVEPPRFDSEASSEQHQQDSYENDDQDDDEDGPSSRSGIDYATARHLLDQNNAQQELIQRLLSENQQLQEMKRQKDQAIQRLLGDIKELRSEGAVGEAMHASGESDVNQLRREVTVLKRHRQMLLSIIDVKDKCLADLWTMLCDVLSEDK